jgi:uncharacterized protein
MYFHLQENSETYISIPRIAFTDEESVSITGWVYLRSAKTGQLFFDFGKDSQSHFFVTPTGTKEKEGFQAQIVTSQVSMLQVRRHSAD